MKKNLIAFFLLFLSCLILSSQSKTTRVNGKVLSDSQPMAFAAITVSNGVIITANKEGAFSLELTKGNYDIKVSAQGYLTIEETIEISNETEINKTFLLKPDPLGLDEVVVSATRNRVERKNAPVVVSSLKPRLFEATQANSLADGLSYAPGVRIETNCQNCGFTQVRLNGLDGAYTQVLLNSRPVFTSLLGVYGLEQIPVNTIERVEVVRSGGSALFGSNAIAGTVNVITKDPILNTWEIGTNLSLIDGDAWDRQVNFNSSIVADNLKSGFTLYGTNRTRDAYDANNDGFTEMVELKNTSVGGKAFYKPNDRSRIGLNLNAINEYRRGGDRLNLAPQFTDITEELDHKTFIGGAEYSLQGKEKATEFKLYTSASYTDRDSYYGGLGGERTPQDSMLANNAFGSTKDLAWVNGVQYTLPLNNNILTSGLEYNINDTEDVVEGYNRLVDQNVQSLGAYSQFEWKLSNRITALIGARLDHVMVDGIYMVSNISRSSDIKQTVVSPRFTFSYELTKKLKFRAGYARGFRTPQAFNEDLHISSVGGEQQFVILSEGLSTEYSNAYTASLNYAQSINLLQLDVLLEGFYTDLIDPFTIVSTGAILENGSILEEVRNGSGAKVYGANFEFGLSPNTQWQFQFGGTLQKALYDNPQLLFESENDTSEPDVSINEFMRTPNLYGYLNASWLPSKRFIVDISGVYTGSMDVPLVISDSGFLQINEVDDFFDLNLRLESHFDFSDDFMITFSGGVKNIFNSYQDDFQVGASRDSDYIYGPNAPRTFFIGLKFGKLH